MLESQKLERVNDVCRTKPSGLCKCREREVTGTSGAEKALSAVSGAFKSQGMRFILSAVSWGIIWVRDEESFRT